MGDPRAVVHGLINGFWLSQAVIVATEIGIPDCLKDGPRNIDDLARASGTHAPSLYRLLRAVSGLGIFKELPDRSFAATEYSRVLESDRPGSLAPSAIYSRQVSYPAWNELWNNVKTGETALEKHFGMSLFEHLEKSPPVLENFNRLVAAVSEVTNDAILSVDFSDALVIVDVGGGHANLLGSILDKVPAARGILFDLPHVVESARVVISEGHRDRIDLVGGSFLESIPKGDTYLIKLVLHDCNDEQALTILKNIQRASAGKARLIMVESVIPDHLGPDGSKLWDLNMMVHGGAERSEREFAHLCNEAGFDLTGITPASNGYLSVIEARGRT